jgi:hypothetical protein
MKIIPADCNLQKKRIINISFTFLNLLESFLLASNYKHFSSNWRNIWHQTWPALNLEIKIYFSSSIFFKYVVEILPGTGIASLNICIVVCSISEYPISSIDEIWLGSIQLIASYLILLSLITFKSYSIILNFQ